MKRKQDDPTVKYVRDAVRKAPTNQTCSGCFFYHLQDNSCTLVESDWKHPIFPGGWCKRWEAYDEALTGESWEALLNKPDPESLPAEIESSDLILSMAARDEKSSEETDQEEGSISPDDLKPIIILDQEKSVRRNLMQRVQKLLRQEPEPSRSGFKLIEHKGQVYWFAAYTNNFMDRDGETFAMKAHRRYVDRVEEGLVDYPELWLSHIPGTRHGKAQQLLHTEHSIIAIGTFDDTPLGDAMKEHYLSKKAGDFELSHGFTYPVWALDAEGTYWDYTTFEISTLPVGLAANPYTPFVTLEEIKIMDEKDKQRIRTTYGEGILSLVEGVETGEQQIKERLGAKYKIFTEAAGKKDPTVPGKKDEGSEGDETEAVVLSDVYDTLQTVFQMLEAQDARMDAMDQQTEDQIKAVSDGRQDIISRLDEVAQALGIEPEPASKSRKTIIASDEKRGRSLTEDQKERRAAVRELNEKEKGVRGGKFAGALPGLYNQD
jgi:hypothetical protein